MNSSYRERSSGFASRAAAMSSPSWPAVTVAVLVLAGAAIAMLALLLRAGGSFVAPRHSGFLIAEGLRGPVSIVCSAGTVYVSDPGAGLVVAHAVDGESTRTIAPRSYGTEGFLVPGQLCAYEGGVLVADPSQRQVFYYDRHGCCGSAFIESDMPVDFRPDALGAFSDGRVVVADNSAHRLYVFGPDGRLRNVIGGEIEEGGQKRAVFAHCSGLVVRGAYIYVLDSDRLEILVVDARGTYRRRVPLRVPRRDVGYVSGLALKGSHVLVADALLSRVYDFDATGRLTGTFGESLDQKKQVVGPVSLALCGSKLFVVEKAAGRVSIWSW